MISADFFTSGIGPGQVFTYKTTYLKLKTKSSFQTIKRSFSNRIGPEWMC